MIAPALAALSPKADDGRNTCPTRGTSFQDAPKGIAQEVSNGPYR